MSSKLMTIIRLILISVLLNTAFLQSEHQLTHLSQNHTLEQCDICSHPSYIDDVIIPALYAVQVFDDNNQILLSTFAFAKQTYSKTRHARAPPFIA
ncbi:hypothetical protein GCM10008107_17700 [Psychrosphaera saromensis]|nr:hypothetical protein GCM10008107_17700 [Psychrosphaera saromensis]GLQ12955.1 hypothetical protein GCM10007917_04100 [Psychrosphaera saromensis]